MPKFDKIIEQIEIEEASIATLNEVMSGEEIAQELGVSRQYVSNTLKSAMRKIYDAIQAEVGDEPFQIALVMQEMLKAGDDPGFFGLFPPDLREKIEADAKDYLSSR